MLKLRNVLTNKEEIFEPLNSPEVLMYTCGPTVYDYAHIGNLSAYLMADLLRRWLEVGHGYQVKQIINITDVGHLVADADEGEDKMDLAAKREKKDPVEIARKYEKKFKDDFAKVNTQEPWKWTRATDYIAAMQEMIQTLLDKGYAYITDSGVYFEVSKFKDYGKLSGNKLEELIAGQRVEIDPAKKHPADFALWKTGDPDHLQQWDSPWGSGYPGWHIECSAMIWKEFGEKTIDIHTGGEDHLFPHHECEIAQSEAATGKKFSSFFIHKKHIMINGKKMSKSLNNFFVLDDVIKMGFDPLDFRYFILSNHYRTGANFDKTSMKAARTTRKKLQNSYNNLIKDLGENIRPDDCRALLAWDNFSKALDDDLNVSGALAAVFSLLAEAPNLSPERKQGALDFIKKFNQVFAVIEEDIKLPIPEEEIEQLIIKRNKLRKQGEYEKADMVREELAEMGIELLDDKGKTTWKIRS